VLHITPWERVALELLADGTTTSDMAGRLGVTEPEVENRLRTLFVRMGARGRSDAIAAAFRRGLLHARTERAGATPGAPDRDVSPP
jgi:DNA-binding NarL/FixJ family response regulator